MSDASYLMLKYFEWKKTVGVGPIRSQHVTYRAPIIYTYTPSSSSETVVAFNYDARVVTAFW